MTRIKVFTVGLPLIFIDQFSKYLIRSQGGFYICNKNLAFGLTVPPVVFWIIIIILLTIIISSFVKGPLRRIEARGLRGIFKIKNFFLHNSLFLIFILSGAISNIIDRLYFGCVIDFIDTKVWPIFNLADAFITLGALFILFSLLKKQKRKDI